MLKLRPATSRGRTRIAWLDSAHTFSFGQWQDPRAMGFRALRVINDDRVAARGGFPTHSHRDMEIISVVIEGELAHKDSLGNGSVIRPGEVQIMSAGTGISHSEFNNTAGPLRFLQIWIFPKERNLPPRYDQKEIRDRAGRLALLASPDGADGSIVVHQDVRLYGGTFATGQSVEQAIAPGRFAFVQVVRGRLTVNGQSMAEGDGLELSQESTLRISDGESAEILVFDLA